LQVVHGSRKWRRASLERQLRGPLGKAFCVRQRE
jgi:hypothetical protein